MLVGLLRILCASLVFLIFETISASSWVGGLATLVYMANSNFYSFLATFSYETIAFDFPARRYFSSPPLLRASTRIGRWRMVCISAPILFALAVSHHLTSWIGVLILGGAAAVGLPPGRPQRRWRDRDDRRRGVSLHQCLEVGRPAG